LCLGAQLLAEAAGGGARPAPAPEIGWRELRLETEAADDPLFGALPGRLFAFEWHAYEIEPPPEGVVLARSDCCLQAFRAGESAWGVQFHAEVTEETVAEWASKDGEEGELREAGLDAADLTAETARRIAESNRLGAELCRRFLGIAVTAGAAAA
jgi:GMP synthase-like glutamine amidotransferase